MPIADQRSRLLLRNSITVVAILCALWRWLPGLSLSSWSNYLVLVMAQQWTRNLCQEVSCRTSLCHLHCHVRRHQHLLK